MKNNNTLPIAILLMTIIISVKLLLISSSEPPMMSDKFMVTLSLLVITSAVHSIYSIINNLKHDN